jgi:guanylate kinase|tara:strand:+ start:24 stop:656 length:633 start_codon:yes stop_codon:yes gene_type:complete
MSSKEDGAMIVLSSPSGAGKTTLTKLLSKNNDYLISVSHTTRKPRINEVDAKDYYFVNEDEFKSLIKKDEFLEHAEVFNHFYGTSKTFVINSLEKGSNVIFDIDWQGAKQIKEKKLKYKLITFFILPPSKKVLFERLSNRDMKDKLIVEERMRQFSKDILHWVDYDYVVVNDNLENCYNEVNNLIKSEMDKISNSYDVELIKKHINQLIS